MLRFARNGVDRAVGRIPPACVGYEAPLATRKVLKAGCAIGVPEAGHTHVKDHFSVDIDND